MIPGIITAHAENEILGGSGSSRYLGKLAQWFNASVPS